MANPFNLGLFKGPRYSAFPITHDNKISMSAGKLTPIYWEFLNQGDKIEADVADVVRLAPMVVPTLDTYRVDIHAFALRLRSLGNANRDPWVYEDFFNLNKNTDGSRNMPMLPLGWLFSLNGFRTGTLLESLGIPTFKKDREEYLDYLRNHCSWVFDPVIRLSRIMIESESALNTGFYPASMPLDPSMESPEGLPDLPMIDVSEIIDSYDLVSGVDGYCRNYVTAGAFTYYFPFNRTLVGYILDKYPQVLSIYGFSKDMLGYTIDSMVDYTIDDLVPFDGINLLDKVYEVYKKDSISVMKDYIDDLLDGFLSLTTDGDVDNLSTFFAFYGYTPTTSIFAHFLGLLYSTYTDLVDGYEVVGVSERYIPAYPFEAYGKILSDWYINTAIEDPDHFFSLHSFLNAFKGLSAGQLTYAQVRQRGLELNELYKRFWANDYFTSAFPSPQAGQAVGIPVNGTIVDLRNANAMQKLKERLLYAGSRFRDVMFAITGKKTSAAILEMSEVLGSWSNIINVDAVLQQSETKINSPQAGYAGTGLGYRAGGKDFRYVAEEPTIIMVLASIVPQASYFQGLSRKLTRCNVYDYAVPQLANVGEQDIKYRELYVSLDNVGVSSGSQVFGYTRRNGDFMWTPNEVHGDFQGSLDFWHNARIFGSMPSLSENFLQVNPADDNLNRVFAVDSDSYDHFYCNFSFTGHVIRALPKHVHYDL